MGYTRWDDDSISALLPRKQNNPTADEIKRCTRTPEGAAPRGKLADVKFLEHVSGSTHLHYTQFADYHGHGWISVLSSSGRHVLLDARNNRRDTIRKFKKAVHIASVT